MTETGLVKDRTTGQLRPERQFGERSLSLLYRSRWARLLQPVATRPWVSELAALSRRTRRSASSIDGFVQQYDIDLDDFVEPAGGWRSFAEFFVREFAPDARPLPADPSLLLSPADGKLLLAPLDGASLVLKGIGYSLENLLGDQSAAAHFSGGTAVIVRLTVDDAHRFCQPASGRLVGGRSTRRLLHTVGPMGTAKFLLTNSRRWRLFDTDEFGPIGLVAVGALLVGRIRLHDRPRFERGDEVGMFELGGSTLVLLTQAGQVAFDDDLLANSAAGFETVVRARESIGRAQ